MNRIQPKLHEVMEDILKEEPNRTASLQRLCDENIRRDLYRKGDATHPKPYQFKLRTLHYDQFEFIAPDQVRLKP